ncbi:MAG: queuine tRNA-ribosyltransferase family protein [Clostridiales bacterium]|nr:queuine tRNA-ribosyltransferase family protein [Clostridiales bacterium]
MTPLQHHIMRHQYRHNNNGIFIALAFVDQLKAEEMIGMRLVVMHNQWFYNTLMEEIRNALDMG